MSFAAKALDEVITNRSILLEQKQKELAAHLSTVRNLENLIETIQKDLKGFEEAKKNI